jgi:hypothetical protein
MEICPLIRLTIDMPRWVWWLALRFRLTISLEVDGQLLTPLDLVQHGRPMTLIYRGRPLPRDMVEAKSANQRSGHPASSP